MRRTGTNGSSPCWAPPPKNRKRRSTLAKSYMQLHGKHLIGFELPAEGVTTFQSFDPTRGIDLPPLFTEAAPGEINRAMWSKQLTIGLLGRRRRHRVGLCGGCPVVVKVASCAPLD